VAAVRSAAQLSEAQSTIIVMTAEPGAVVTSTKPTPAKAEPPNPELEALKPAKQQAHASGGWLIQIGAFDGEAEAKQHLSEAQLNASTALAAADPFTERVQRCAFRRSRPLIPTDRDQLFRSIATSAARVLRAPLDDGGDVSLLFARQARREAVPVVNRRDPRATRSALMADAAARAGGPC
jgi:hypothetical protein